MTGQQLKNSILQLAIQGKLVPQNPEDEPASELLKRIRAEKEKLVKEKKLKKSALDVTPISEDDKPFEIPEGWEWCRLDEISLDSADGPFGSNLKREHYTENREVRIIQLSNIGELGWKDANVRYTTFEHLPNISRSEAFAGDIIIAKMMPAGRAIICPNHESKFVLSSDAVRFDFSDELYKKYLYYAINSSVFKEQVYGQVQGITRVRTSLNKLRTYILPLPPLQEQHRIVEKIEELMPLVDKYDKAQKRFDVLNANIPETLKKSILQEAIQGKLGTNNPADESASELSKRIRVEKEKLVKEKKIKKEKTLPEISEDEKPFEIPDNWVWCRLGDLVSNRAGLAYNKSSLEIKSNSMIRVLRGGNINYGEWVTLDNDVMISSEFVKDDLILKKGMFITPAVTSLECMGKTALIREDQTDIVVGGFVLMFIPTLNDVDLLEYLNLLFQSYYYKLYCQSITNKSGQAFFNISRQKLMECLIPLPPLQEQHRIVEKLNELLPKLKNIR